MTIKELEKKVREQASEIAELREMVDRAKAKREDMEKDRRCGENRGAAMYDSLLIERTDLIARVGRIDQRILVLGREPPDTIFSQSAKLRKNRQEGPGWATWKKDTE